MIGKKKRDIEVRSDRKKEKKRKKEKEKKGEVKILEIGEERRIKKEES